jgi:hypothetical protein
MGLNVLVHEQAVKRAGPFDRSDPFVVGNDTDRHAVPGQIVSWAVALMPKPVIEGLRGVTGREHELHLFRRSHL